MNRPSPEPDILAAFLDEPARGALEAEAGSDPARAKVIEESYRLREALERGREIEALELTDLLVAFAALGDGPLSDTWRSRIRERLREDPASAENIAQVRQKARSLEDGSNAADHFASLTGHDAAPGPSSRGLWLAAASVVFLVFSHGLFERITEDAVRRAAWSQIERPRPTRAGAASDIDRASEFAKAARGSLLGMWPRYNQERLLQAESLLAGRTDPPAVLLRAQIQAAAGQFERSHQTLEGAAPYPEPAGWQELRQILAPKRAR